MMRIIPYGASTKVKKYNIVLVYLRIGINVLIKCSYLVMVMLTMKIVVLVSI